MPKYPEHDKLEKIHDQSQAIGEFLDWLGEEKGIFLAQRSPDRASFEFGPAIVMDLTPKIKHIEEFFEIDPVKLEKEKRQMLKELQKTSKGD